jgi:GT2 family glycosyltransferase
MPKFSIIIPVCGQEELTKNCIASIRKHSEDPEIILVENGQCDFHIEADQIISNEKNLGFPIAVNQGIRASHGDIVVILNNDTLVTPHWLNHLAEHLKYADIVGPVTNYISGPQKIPFHRFNTDFSLEKFANDLYKKNKLESFPFHRLVFFCVAIKREVFDKIGFLDEQFSPGNFEDDDFCLRAIQAGFELVIATDVFIYHVGSQTHNFLNLDYAKLLETNKAKFFAKWPESTYYDIIKRYREKN